MLNTSLAKYSTFSHLLILSSTGIYISTNMGFGASYLIVDGKSLFCRPFKFKNEPGFHERLGRIDKVRIITQAERILIIYASFAMKDTYETRKAADNQTTA